jgi:hypothetical protein
MPLLLHYGGSIESKVLGVSKRHFPSTRYFYPSALGSGRPSTRHIKPDVIQFVEFMEDTFSTSLRFDRFSTKTKSVGDAYVHGLMTYE